jgi:hypothetical protein
MTGVISGGQGVIMIAAVRPPGDVALSVVP